MQLPADGKSRGAFAAPATRWLRVYAQAGAVALTLLLGAQRSDAAISVRLRWQPSPSAGVTGYRVWVRPANAATPTTIDAGLPATATDGAIAFVVGGIDAASDTAFAVTAYRADHSESAPSSERVLRAQSRTSPCRTDAQCNDLNPCTNDACRSGSCTHTAALNGTACSDGNVCNGADQCQSGVCRPGTALSCDDRDACTTDACNPTTGCTHATVPNCPSAACTTWTQCIDQNPCTADTCRNGACVHTALKDGASCTDKNVCNGVETCRAGRCVAGDPLSCDDGNRCTTDACNATSGCMHTTATSCDDGNACTADACTATGCSHTPIPNCQACSSAAQCNDANPCTADACTAGRCTHTAAANGTSCDNGTRCDGAETCQAGTCRKGTAPSCDDGNACTADACAPATGCTHTTVPSCQRCTKAADCGDGNACTTDLCRAGVCQHAAVKDGSACGDGNLCNGVESCRSGQCAAGVPLDCNDGSTCTTDVCDAKRGCTHVERAGCTDCTSAAQCDDGDACTRDTCTGWSCAHERIPHCRKCSLDGQCNDGNACTTDRCVVGLCQFAAVVDGSSCSDGNWCNGEESCQAGTCRPGVPPSCDDGSRCTTDVCKPTGCAHTAIAGCNLCQANGCDDANPCTQDVCDPARGCRHATVLGCERCASAADCADGDPCTADACDATGRCRSTPRTSCSGCTTDVDCDDADACTAERCVAGACAREPVVCATAGTCTEAICDPDSGCATQPLPDGTACPTADPCEDGACRQGTCGTSRRLRSSTTQRHALAVQHLSIGPNGTHRRIVGRGRFLKPAAFDPVRDGATVELRRADGTILWTAHVAPGEFEERQGMLRYRAAPAREGNGLRAMRLRVGRRHVNVRVRGVTPGDPSTPKHVRLTWVVRSGSQCASRLDLRCAPKTGGRCL